MRAGNIASAPAGGKADPLAPCHGVLVSIDTVSFLWPWAKPKPRSLKQHLRQLIGQPVESKTKRNEWGAIIGTRYSAPRTHERLPQLLAFLNEHGIGLCEAHVAFDLHFEDALQRTVALQHVRQRIDLKRGAKVERRIPVDEYGESDGGIELADFSKDAARSKPPPRHGTVYPKPDDVLRIELKVVGGPALRRHLPPLASITETDPRELFMQHFVQRQLRPRVKARFKGPQGIWERVWLNTPRMKARTTLAPFSIDAPWRWAPQVGQ